MKFRGLWPVWCAVKIPCCQTNRFSRLFHIEGSVDLETGTSRKEVKFEQLFLSEFRSAHVKPKLIFGFFVEFTGAVFNQRFHVIGIIVKKQTGQKHNFFWFN